MRKIVSDSTCDLIFLEDIAEGTSFEKVPLKIIVDGKEFVDDENVDLDKMLQALAQTTQKTSTACPSPGEYLESFGDANEVFVVTITSKLSGSYSSAYMAKEMYEEEYLDRKVHVFDSLSTSGEMILIIEKINGLIKENKTFEEIVKIVELYIKESTHLDFILYSVENLVKNGRLNKIVGAALNVLGVKIVGRANEGILQPFAKVRGKDKVFECIHKEMKNQGYKGGKVHISHCKNEKGATRLKEEIVELYPDANVSIRNARGLVSYYAEVSGILIGYEC